MTENDLMCLLCSHTQTLLALLKAIGGLLIQFSVLRSLNSEDC